MAALAAIGGISTRDPPPTGGLRLALDGAGTGLAFGVGANCVALRFIAPVVPRFTGFPLSLGLLLLGLLAMLEGTRWMVACIAYRSLLRMQLPSPAAFALGIYAGTFVPTMLPWTPAGGLAPIPALLQLAELIGERGVSALMALEAAALAEVACSFARRRTSLQTAWLAAVGSAIFAGQLAYGLVRIAAVERMRANAPRSKVALVQPSIEPSLDGNAGRGAAVLAKLSDITRRAEAQGVDVVVWPEGAYPYPLRHGQTRTSPDRAVVQPGIRGPIVTGLETTDWLQTTVYNSSLLATSDGMLAAPYDKRHPLWFGEIMPFADDIPFIRRIWGRRLGITAGTNNIPIVVGKLRAAVLICYEDTLPRAGREAMTVHPNVILNLTNDGWFQGSIESDLHTRVSTVRAIELRRDLLRSVNLGAPSWIDAAGEMRAHSAATKDILIAEPALLDIPATIYARFGDLPWVLSAVLGVLAHAFGRSLLRARVVQGT
jgi:apolipoprotein N-acyltransferase